MSKASPNHPVGTKMEAKEHLQGQTQQRQGWQEVSGVMNTALRERKKPIMLEADITLRG